MQFITRPLQDWNRPRTVKRTHGNYGVGYEKCLNLLERELEHLGVKGDVIIQIDMPEGSIRRDGMPYAGQKAASPRVAIAFTCKHGPLTYRCDAHWEWQDNVRAIGLGLERLRLVERTGITSRGEQYTGFKALPGGIPLGAAMTLEEAALFVATKAAPLVGTITDASVRFESVSVGARSVIADSEVFQQLYHLAAKSLHPDVAGEREAWDRLQVAADLLKKHHGIA